MSVFIISSPEYTRWIYRKKNYTSYSEWNTITNEIVTQTIGSFVLFGTCQTMVGDRWPQHTQTHNTHAATFCVYKHKSTIRFRSVIFGPNLGNHITVLFRTSEWRRSIVIVAGDCGAHIRSCGPRIPALARGKWPDECHANSGVRQHRTNRWMYSCATILRTYSAAADQEQHEYTIRPAVDKVMCRSLNFTSATSASAST